MPKRYATNGEYAYVFFDYNDKLTFQRTMNKYRHLSPDDVTCNHAKIRKTVRKGRLIGFIYADEPVLTAPSTCSTNGR